MPETSAAAVTILVLAVCCTADLYARSPYHLATCSKTAITVTDEKARSGRQCLKFSDHPEAKRQGFPYLYVTPSFLTAGCSFSCALLLEPDATATIEFRSTPSARNSPVGPSLRFEGGCVVVPGRDSVARLAPGEWVCVEVRFRFGSGTFDLTLTPEGGASEALLGLPCRSPAFRQCTWIGIISPGKAESAFYIDDLVIAPLEEEGAAP